MALIKILEGRQSIPEITHIYDYNDHVALKNGNIKLEILGYSFSGLPSKDPTNNIFNAYIRSSNSTAMFGISSLEVDMFKNITTGGSRSLAVLFPSFTAFEVTYNILSENIMTIDVPPIYEDGCFDIILLNRAGYTSSSQALGTFACTTSDLDTNYEAPLGLLKQSGENILSEHGDDILINLGANPTEENPRIAGDTVCDP